MRTRMAGQIARIISPNIKKDRFFGLFLLFSDIAFSDKRNVVRRKDNFPIDSETVKQLIDGFAEIIA